MAKPAILVTGGTGQVGTGIVRAARDVEIVAPGRDALNLTDPASIDRMVDSRDWAAVINCAAYTAVDKAESDRDTAFAVNAVAPGRIAEDTARRDIPLLHVSTDYVFDGDKPEPYVEGDPVAPLGVYGASKEAGERAVRDANPRHIILRTAWVISPWGQNFVRTMIRLGAERPALGVVADQVGCPTSAADIADTLLAIARDPSERWGTYHFVNAGEASWFDLAAAVFAHVAAAGGKTPALNPITTADYPTPARRPANSRLSTERVTQSFGITPRPWQDALDDIMAALVPQGAHS
jgi:dTDP-4-dehydrorhamnose reductase